MLHARLATTSLQFLPSLKSCGGVLVGTFFVNFHFVLYSGDNLQISGTSVQSITDVMPTIIGGQSIPGSHSEPQRVTHAIAPATWTLHAYEYLTSLRHLWA